ncbi:hypothetical protein INR49_017376 [Caranx melampygus]|nr:hypothetical protein INR49_017376 [Caranx melampygus]
MQSHYNESPVVSHKPPVTTKRHFASKSSICTLVNWSVFDSRVASDPGGSQVKLSLSALFSQASGQWTQSGGMDKPTVPSAVDVAGCSAIEFSLIGPQKEPAAAAAARTKELVPKRGPCWRTQTGGDRMLQVTKGCGEHGHLTSDLRQRLQDGGVAECGVQSEGTVVSGGSLLVQLLSRETSGLPKELLRSSLKSVFPSCTVRPGSC